MTRVTRHFKRRVAERIGRDVDAGRLAAILDWAIEHDRTDVAAFAGRVSRDGRRLWRFRMPDGRTFYAMRHHAADAGNGDAWITVLAAGSWVPRERNRRLWLKEIET